MKINTFKDKLRDTTYLSSAYIIGGLSFYVASSSMYTAIAGSTFCFFYGHHLLKKKDFIKTFNEKISDIIETPLSDKQIIDDLLHIMDVKGDISIHILKNKRTNRFQKILFGAEDSYNAFEMTFKNKSFIGMTKNMFNHLNSSERKFVYAHEMAHILAQHNKKKLLIAPIKAITYSMALMEITSKLYDTISSHGLSTLWNTYTNPDISLGLNVAPTLALLTYLSSLAYKRGNEFQADRIAIEATEDIQSFENAMVKLKTHNEIDTSHDMLPKRFTKPPIIARLFNRASDNISTHPNHWRRVAHARKIYLKTQAPIIKRSKSTITP